MEASGQMYFGEYVTDEDVQRLRDALTEEQRKRADALITQLVPKEGNRTGPSISSP